MKWILCMMRHVCVWQWLSLQNDTNQGTTCQSQRGHTFIVNETLNTPRIDGVSHRRSEPVGLGKADVLHFGNHVVVVFNDIVIIQDSKAIHNFGTANVKIQANVRVRK